MSRYELRDEEVAAIRTLLAAVTIEERSNEIGVTHAGRFVTSRHGVSQTGVAALDALSRKVGGDGLRIAPRK
jgi:hypothetical protein